MRNPHILAALLDYRGDHGARQRSFGELAMHRVRISRPKHDQLVRRAAHGLLDETLRLSDIDGRTDREVDRLLRRTGTVADTCAPSSPAPV